MPHVVRRDIPRCEVASNFSDVNRFSSVGIAYSDIADAVDAGYAEPARHSVFASHAYTAAYPADFRTVLRETRTYARINRPLIPFGFELGDIVGIAAQSAIAGEQTAADALRDAQRTIDGMVWTANAVAHA